MSADYLPTQISGPGADHGNRSPELQFKITLNFIHGSRAGTTQTFTTPIVTFGRGPDNNLQFDATRDTKVSTRHGRLTCDSNSGQWYVEDLGSTNGTFIDGTRIDTPAALASGMTIVLGDASEAGGVIFTVELNRSSDLFGSAPTGTFTAPGAASPPPISEPPPVPSDFQSPPPSADSGGKPGLFGRMKAGLNKMMERNKLNGHLKTLQTNLAQLKQQHVPVYASLGKEVVEADHLDHEKLASLPATTKVRELQGQIASSDETIVGIEKEIGADETAFQDWLSTFGTSFAQLESAHTTATEDTDAAKKAFNEATTVLNEHLRPRLEAMDATAAKLGAIAAGIRATPEATTHEQLNEAMQSVREALTALEAPLETLPELVATHGTTKQTLADAEAKQAELSKQLDQERATKAQRQSEYDALVAGKKQQVEAQRTTIAGLKTQIEQQHSAIGEAATLASAEGTFDQPSLQQMSAAKSALDAARGVESEIQKTNKRLEELKQLNRVQLREKRARRLVAAQRRE